MTRFTRFTLAAALALAFGFSACVTDDSDGGSGDSADVGADTTTVTSTGTLSCGSLTCDADQFCLEDCRSCSGIDLGMGSSSSGFEYSCVAPASSCVGDPVQCLSQDPEYNNCEVQTDRHIVCQVG